MEIHTNNTSRILTKLRLRRNNMGETSTENGLDRKMHAGVNKSNTYKAKHDVTTRDICLQKYNRHKITHLNVLHIKIPTDYKFIYEKIIDFQKIQPTNSMSEKSNKKKISFDTVH
uniref:Uncharacterized protein n=1 Tax=Cacopsylla melanoneura TaxID=428564 RepID=A0A8D8VVJ7_9HEMI